MNDIREILDLDETEYDKSLDSILNNINDDAIFDYVEPLIITKIMGFEENYIEANKYILHILKNIQDIKFSKYQKVFYDSIKLFMFGTYNDEYKQTLLNNLNSKNINYINYFLENIEQDEFYNFMKDTIKLNKNIKYQLINILTKSQNLRKKLLNKGNDGRDYELKINLLSYLKQEDFDINDNEYYESINNFMTEEDSMKLLYEYLNDILDKNKSCGFKITNMDQVVDHTKLSSARFLALTLKTCLIIFSNLDKSKIFSNTDKTFESTQRKDFECKEDDNIETKLYISILKSFKLIHDYIVSMYLEVKSLSVNNIFGGFFGLNDETTKLKLKITKNIIMSDHLNELITEFIKYYSDEFLQINNEAVDTIIQYYFNMNKIYQNYKFPDFVINYFYKLISTNSEYCNKHYKFDILSILCNIYDKKDVEIKNPLKLMEAIILYHDENDMFKAEQSQIAHKYYNSSLRILERIIANNHIESNSMNELFLKFFYRTNSHTISFLELTNSICEEIAEKATDLNTPAYRSRYLPMIKSIINNVNISLKVINDILKKGILNPAIFKGEIILPVITLSTNVLKYFTNGRNAIYNVFNMNFEALDIMKLSLNILHKLSDNDEFTDLIQETKSIVLDALPYIKFKDDEIYIKDELKNNLEIKKDEIKLEDIPEEFLDPLIFTLIKEPVMIPNVDLIFDKSSIMSQIYHEKINPYTREQLDEKILEQYNTKEEVVKKIKDFLNKLQLWKVQHI